MMYVKQIRDLIKATHHKSTAGVCARAALAAYKESEAQRKQADKLLRSAYIAKEDETLLQEVRRARTRRTVVWTTSTVQGPIEPPLIPDLVEPPPAAAPTPAEPPTPPADTSSAEPRRGSRVRQPTTRQLFAEHERTLRREQAVERILPLLRQSTTLPLVVHE